MRCRGRPSLRELIGRARRLGLNLYLSGGDYVIKHPGHGTLRVNARRHDATPALVKLVTQLEEQRQ